MADDNAIHRSEVILPSEPGETDSVIIGHEVVAGDSLGGPAYMGIVDMPTESEHDGPYVRRVEYGAEEGR